MPHRNTIFLVLLCIGSPVVHAQYAKAPGLGDPGKLRALVIETGRSRDGSFALAGRDAGQQLAVTGQYATGQVRDLTGQVRFEAQPAGIVAVLPTGYVTALTEGTTTIHVEGPEATRASVKVTVSNILRDVPVNFTNEVVPILTRFGCNSGGCHGKSGGQNGFQLSLLGFEAAEDYDFIVKEARGRRVVPSAAEASILLRKASGTMPHGGGTRIKTETPAYRLLRRWIEQGMPLGGKNDPVVARLEVVPAERLLQSGGSQQLTAIAHYSDGTAQDVTRLTQFEPNDAAMASVSETGLVTVKDLPGTVAIMARFQAQVDVFRATMPRGVPVANLPAPKNYIDAKVFAHWQKLGLPPSDVCDDATFLRRVTLDIAGRLPTLAEFQAWRTSQDADRRAQLVERLLASKDYADTFTVKWSAVLRNKRQSVKDDSKPTVAFHDWIRDSLDRNKPFDQLVREILTASGEEVLNPPVAWYREVKDVFAQVEDTAQLFLGTRLGCARCHHHPLEKLSQQDYYGLAAFFSRLTYKVPPPVIVPKGQKKPKEVKPPVHVLHKAGPATAINPRTGSEVGPTLLGGTPVQIAADVDPRLRLAEWVTSKDNPYFARTLVNRYWKHFFGRGLVDPEDDLRRTNPPTNPELLDALARDFVESGFDLKKLVRTICSSTVYQLSSMPNVHNAGDRQSFSRFQPRRLPAEVLFDAIDQVTLAKPAFAGVPAGTRAVQLPDNAFDSYFLTVFGRPDASSACECERSSEVNLAQTLHLMNSSEILAKVGAQAKAAAGKPAKGKNPPTRTVPGERITLLVKDSRGHEEKVRELYLAAYAREPSTAETALLLEHIAKHGTQVRAAYEDILWVLINSEEFLFNH